MNFILGNFIKHWQESSEIGTNYLIQAIDFGVMAGDLQYAEYSYSSMLEMTYASGIPLSDVKGYIKKIDGFDDRMKNDIVNITINMLEYAKTILRKVSFDRKSYIYINWC